MKEINYEAAAVVRSFFGPGWRALDETRGKAKRIPAR